MILFQRGHSYPVDPDDAVSGAESIYFLALYLSSAKSYIDGMAAQFAGRRKELPMKFRPLHDRVVIRRAEGDSKSKGGVIIPDSAKEKPQQGEVIAVGLGARDESGKLVPLEVKAGDLILFGKWSGTEVRIDGEDLLIMKEADVMGIIAKSDRATEMAA